MNIGNKTSYTTRDWIIPGIILLIALTARLVYAAGIDSMPFSDMADYDKLAQSLAHGQGFTIDGRVTAYRPPGYPAFMALVYSVAGHSPRLVRIVQALTGTGCCVLAFFIARRLLASCSLPPAWLRAAALMTALFAALYDEWIFFTGQLLTETLFIFLLGLWLLLALRWQEKTQAHPGSLIIPGLLAGALTLVRPVAVFAVFPAAAWMLFQKHRSGLSRKRIASQAGVFFAAWALLCLPWMIRNAVHFGPLAGLSTNTGVNFYIGHNPHFGYWSTGEKQRIREMTQLNESEESRLFLKTGLSYAFKHPGATLQRTALKAIYLFLEPWRPWPQSTQRFYQRALDPWAFWSNRHIAPYKPWPWFGHGRQLPPQSFYPFPLIGWTLPVIALVAVGMILAFIKHCHWGILNAAMLGHVVSCLVFFARARFRAPLGYLFAIAAALAMVSMVHFCWDNWQKHRRNSS
jgi:4-amino-4-deoxy-L-arabinose transferase-like glycosyltransferase